MCDKRRLTLCSYNSSSSSRGVHQDTHIAIQLTFLFHHHCRLVFNFCFYSISINFLSILFMASYFVENTQMYKTSMPNTTAFLLQKLQISYKEYLSHAVNIHLIFVKCFYYSEYIIFIFFILLPYEILCNNLFIPPFFFI